MRASENFTSAVLCDEVPKVTEALRAPFWHFRHPRAPSALRLLSISWKEPARTMVTSYPRGRESEPIYPSYRTGSSSLLPSSDNQKRDTTQHLASPIIY